MGKREDGKLGQRKGWLEMEKEVVEMAAGRSRGGGGGGLRRWRRLENGCVTMTTEKNPWPGQGVAAVVVAAATAMAVGLLPRPSLSSHLRGRSLLSFCK